MLGTNPNLVLLRFVQTQTHHFKLRYKPKPLKYLFGFVSCETITKIAMAGNREPYFGTELIRLDSADSLYDFIISQGESADSDVLTFPNEFGRRPSETQCLSYEDGLDHFETSIKRSPYRPFSFEEKE